MKTTRFDPPAGPRRADSEPGRRPDEDIAHRSALRLTFSFRRSHVELILMETIEMIVPPSIEITGEPPGAEFWYELHDGQETPIYRRVQRNPLSPSVEVRNHDRERSLVHVNSGRSVGEFTLLLPNLPEAESVVLYEWSLPEDAIQRELSPVPSEIARFAVGRAIDKSAIARDTIPPRTVSDALAVYDGMAAIHLQASDNTGQVANTFYRLDEGEPQEGLTATTDEPGVHTLLFWSVDRAGIVESENRVTFTVHKVTERREV